MQSLSLMFTLAICTILNGDTQVDIKILLIQTYHTTCVSFSCQFIFDEIMDVLVTSEVLKSECLQKMSLY